jgi:S1-C subfamily serine protease
MTFLTRLIKSAVVGAVLLAVGVGAAQANTNPQLSGLDVTALRQSTVHIRNFSAAENGTFNTSIGSGFVIDSQRCLVVTNAHVVNNSAFLQVYRATDTTNTAPIRARIVGLPDARARVDVALLQLERCDGLPQVRFGNPSALRVGDIAIAVGSPMGLTDTLTVGVVSHLLRQNIAGAPGGYIQTDAAINPGNSGGPLFNARGEVVGMNTAIISRSGGSHGLGLAIPITTVQSVVTQILARGEPAWPATGATVAPLSQSAARVFGVPANLLAQGVHGAVVTGVTTDSAADKGGLRARDVILSVNGNNVTGPSGLDALLFAHTPGQTVTLRVLRDGAMVTLRVTLDNGFTAAASIPAEAYTGHLGMRVMTLRELYTQSFRDAFEQLPANVRAQMQARGVDVDVLARRQADLKAAEFGAMADALVVAYIHNQGPAHASGIMPVRYRTVGLGFAPGITLPLRDVVTFTTVTGVMAEGMPYRAIRTAAELEAFVAEAHAANRTVVLELSVVARPTDDSEATLNEDALPRGTTETDENGLRRTRVYVDLSPRAFGAN